MLLDIEAVAVVGNREAEHVVVGDEVDRHLPRGRRVFGDVLQRLAAAEVQGALDLAREAAACGRTYAGGDRTPRRDRAERLAPPVGREPRGINAVCGLPDLLQGGFDVVGEGPLRRRG